MDPIQILLVMLVLYNCQNDKILNMSEFNFGKSPGLQQFNCFLLAC